MMPCLGVSPQSLDARCWRALLGGGSPTSFFPLVPARVKRVRPFGGSPLLIVGPLQFRALGERAAGFCPLPPSPSGPFMDVPMVNLWPFLLLWSPELDVSTTGPVGASKPYLWRTRRPCSVLTPLVPVVCLSRFPAPYLSTVLPRCGCIASTVPGPPVLSSYLPPDLCASVAWVAGGVSVPSPPPYVFPRHSLTLGGHSGGFVPLGKLCHSGGVNALLRLDSPVHYQAVPPWVLCHSGGLAASLLFPHSR